MKIKDNFDGCCFSVICLNYKQLWDYMIKTFVCPKIVLILFRCFDNEFFK